MLLEEIHIYVKPIEQSCNNLFTHHCVHTTEGNHSRHRPLQTLILALNILKSHACKKQLLVNCTVKMHGKRQFYVTTPLNPLKQPLQAPMQQLVIKPRTGHDVARRRTCKPKTGQTLISVTEARLFSLIHPNVISGSTHRVRVT